MAVGNEEGSLPSSHPIPPKIRTFLAELPPLSEGAEAEVGPVLVHGALRPVGAVVLPRGAHRRLLLAHHAEPPVRARTADEGRREKKAQMLN